MAPHIHTHTMHRGLSSHTPPAAPPPPHHTHTSAPCGNRPPHRSRRATTLCPRYCRTSRPPAVRAVQAAAVQAAAATSPSQAAVQTQPRGWHARGSGALQVRCRPLAHSLLYRLQSNDLRKGKREGARAALLCCAATACPLHPVSASTERQWPFLLATRVNRFVCLLCFALPPCCALPTRRRCSRPAGGQAPSLC